MRRLALSFLLSLALTAPAAGQEAGSVTLPLADYERLVENVETVERLRKEGEKPVADLVEQRTEVTVHDGEAEIVTRLLVELRGTPTRPVVLPLPGLAEAVTVEPRRGAALHRREGDVVLVAPEPGSYTVVVRGRAQTDVEAGVERLTLVASPAPVRSVVVDLPADREWTCDGATVISDVLSDGGRRRLELAPQRGTAHVLETRRRLEGDAEERALLRLSVVTVLEVDGRHLRRQDVVLYEVLRGELGRFELELPPGLEVDRVATDEGDTTARIDDGRLSVERRRRLTKSGHLLVRFAASPFSARDAAAGVVADVALAPVTPPVAPQARYLVTAAAVAALVEPRPGEAWSRVDVEDLPQRLRGELGAIEPNAVWRLAAGAAAPSVRVGVLDAVETLGAVVKSRDTMTLWTVDGSLVHRDRLTLRGAATAFEVFLPAGATLWSTSVDGIAVRPLERGGAVVVPLVFQGAGETVVELVAVEERAIERGRSQVRLRAPRVALPVLRHTWRLLLPRGNRYRYAGGELRPVPQGAARRPPGAVTTGILGQVKSEGMALPGVTLTLRPGNVVTTSDSQGWFAFPGLAPGSYEVEAYLEGFNTFQHPRVRVRAGRSTRLDVELPLAVMEETIVITPEAPLLDAVEAERQWERIAEEQMQQSFGDALDDLESGLAGGVKPLLVEIPETGKVLILSGALPPSEIAAELEVRKR